MEIPEEDLNMLNEDRGNLAIRNMNVQRQTVDLRDAFRDKPTRGVGSCQFDQLGHLTTVQDYENDTPDDNMAFGLAVLSAKISTHPLETVGAALSITKQCWVNLRVGVERVANHAGIHLQTVHVPSQAEAYFLNLDLVKEYSALEMITISGSLFLLLFKNVTSVNYDQFFTRRMSAMRALAGVPSPSQIGPLFNLERAGHVRQVLGANNTFCKAVIECLIEERTRDGDYSRFCDYLLDIISWTGMSAYRWVYECLMLNNSPIFFSPVVRAEVLALNDVITTIARCRYPVFFPYFGSPDDVSKLKRARFPMIISVARLVKQQTNSPAANNFVLPVIGEQMRLAEELADYHQRAVSRRRE